MGGLGEDTAACRRKQNVAALDALHPIRTEAIERPIRGGRRRGLVSTQDGQLEVREEGRMRPREADYDRVLALLVRLGDGIHDAGMTRSNPWRRERL